MKSDFARGGAKDAMDAMDFAANDNDVVIPITTFCSHCFENHHS